MVRDNGTKQANIGEDIGDIDLEATKRQQT